MIFNFYQLTGKNIWEKCLNQVLFNSILSSRPPCPACCNYLNQRPEYQEEDVCNRTACGTAWLSKSQRRLQPDNQICFLSVQTQQLQLITILAPGDTIIAKIHAYGHNKQNRFPSSSSSTPNKERGLMFNFQKPKLKI